MARLLTTIKPLPQTACFVFLTILTFAFTLAVLLSNTTNAAVSASEWKADQIIDDSVFFNGNDMSIEQIQAFLNSQVPVCDTWGSRPSELGGPDLNGNGTVTRAEWGSANGYPSPYICLRDYYENPSTRQNNLQTGAMPTGAISAANIIRNAAVNNGVSARALLVMIQKESPGPLITDTWPLARQYRNAMGFGCPDTAPCDPQYEGFANQINNAARQFVIYKNNPNSYRHRAGQVNSVLYNPNYNCGSSSVYIKSAATAGLYNYTPYQPNNAALANLYGSGDACSAYGNRNFWRMFRDWFGPTTSFYGNRSSASTNYASSPCTIPAFTEVGRLYNPDTSDYLFTTSQAEACSAVKLGYIWDGVVMKNDAGNGGTVPVYRLRYSSTHVYAVSTTQRDELVASGFSDEGIVFYGHASPTPGRLPVYQLGQNNTYVLSSAGGEGSYFVNTIGYPSRGVGFYTTSLGESASLLRLRQASDRLYTISNGESTYAQQLFRYRPEADAGQVDTSPGQYSLPVYRLVGPSGRLYTTSRIERDLAVINYGFSAEGIGFYSYVDNLPGAKPVYRSTNYQISSRLYTHSLPESNDSRTYYGYRTEGISWYGL